VEQLEDGRWQLRFTRTFPHSPEKVWRAITNPDDLARWFPTTIDGDRAAGAPLRFTFPQDQAPAMDGQMLAFEPESVMELQWGPDVIRIELRPVPEGTELTLLDTLEARGKAARDGAGWHVCLDSLEAALRHEPSPRGETDKWKQVHSRYVESFGPAATTIGPPEGLG
jgi:uncharacterized protein YndB with AHSA1/START domain